MLYEIPTVYSLPCTVHYKQVYVHLLPCTINCLHVVITVLYTVYTCKLTALYSTFNTCTCIWSRTLHVTHIYTSYTTYVCICCCTCDTAFMYITVQYTLSAGTLCILLYTLHACTLITVFFTPSAVQYTNLHMYLLRWVYTTCLCICYCAPYTKYVNTHYSGLYTYFYFAIWSKPFCFCAFRASFEDKRNLFSSVF